MIIFNKMYNPKSSKLPTTHYGYPVHPGLHPEKKNETIFGVGDSDKKNSTQCHYDRKNDTSGGHMIQCPKIRR